MEMAAWLIPYTSGLFKLENVCLRYLSQRRDNRQWLGMMDSLIALAYLRFRPGAKLHIRGFKITNDHSHQLQIRDYQLDFQGIKRSILGGSSTDLLNLKTPIYYSYQILADLAPDDRQIILQLALESVIYLQEDTYARDLNALEYLHSIQLLLTEMLKVYGLNNLDNTGEIVVDSKTNTETVGSASTVGSDVKIISQSSNNFPNSQLEDFLCIKSDYLDHPYTQENLRIWKNNLPLLRDICHQFKQAHERYLHGGSYEENLNQIREGANRMRHMMNTYVENIEKI